ncbi:hypothetical protein E2C01_052279 [Portunus trituberculatus]|uniref:Uncharacterized protein n=1 Tax=Portunus trituberculatus TaxID=210409 RepID=A0A5B7GLF7_PORTR|nr:hypothetical protein [Portunus trituberculatus]
MYNLAPGVGTDSYTFYGHTTQSHSRDRSVLSSANTPTPPSLYVAISLQHLSHAVGRPASQHGGTFKSFNT